MSRYGSRRTVSNTTTTTTTTEGSPDSSSERRIRRLRLTLHAGDNGSKESKTVDTAGVEKDVNDTWKKKNGLIYRERPAGRESPPQQLRDTTNGVPETSLHHGPKVYGVVQRTGSGKQQEVMARGWTMNHLQDEMRYIREVRDSLEKVRERMYGQFGGMQQSMEKLSEEIRTANSQRRSLESEVKVRTAAMESFDQMNSSLISANIGLQKSLLENCQNRVSMREEVKSLKSTCEKTQEKLRDKERELAAAQTENQTLRLQVESSRESSARALQELSAKLQREYEEKLQEEQQKHWEEIENLQAQLDEYVRRLEAAERNIRMAEAKIAERDQRIVEVERLLDCMGTEKGQLQKKLQECEQRLRLMERADTTDAAVAKSPYVVSFRSEELQGEASDLRDRIRHLNDMVFCQQRKVKGMIEEVESLRAQVAQKDMFISELLDRIAIVECENNELEDKLKYFMSTQSRPQEVSVRRDIGVGCDLPPRREAQRNDVEPVQCEPANPHSMQLPSPVTASSPTQPSSPIRPPSSPQWPSPVQPSSPTQPSPPSSPIHHPSSYLTMPTQPRTFKASKPPPSRLESSLLRYTPIQYSRFLQSGPSAPSTTSSCSHQSETDPDEKTSQAGRDEVDAETKSSTQSSKEEADSSPSSPRRAPRIYTPFMKLMEITANIKIEKLLQTLPDKGKKMKDFEEKLRLAVEKCSEEERRQSLVTAARTELQSKYQQAFMHQQRGFSTTPTSLRQNGRKEDSAGGVVQERETSPVSADATLDKQQDQFVSRAVPVQTMEAAAAEVSLASEETKEEGLVEALDRVRLSATGTGEPKEQLISSVRDNYFLQKQEPKTPHYITVLSKAETSSAPRRPKFKPNQLPRNYVPSSGSSSPGLSSGSASPLSAQARRERDRKHLDDITAAKLPPLHHSPAQLLSVEESAVLLREQTRRQQELQAKLAAQKLSEGLKISMGSYTPDGGPMAAYREVNDEGAQLSSEED
ncbi:protein GRINL1A [Xenentodon cancila]